MRLRVGAASLCCLLTAAACGGASNSAATPPTNQTTTVASNGTTTATSAPNLTSELLTIADLPTGWSVDNSPINSASEPTCLKPLQQLTGSDARVMARFNGGANGLPSFEENIAHFPGGAAPGIAHFDQVLTSCRTVTFSSGGQTSSATIGAMSFPKLGDESHAYQVALTFKGFTFGLDIIVAGRGNTAMSLVFDDLGTPDLTLVQQLATAAVGKLLP